MLKTFICLTSLLAAVGAVDAPPDPAQVLTPL
jgi:hypothetical protein